MKKEEIETIFGICLFLFGLTLLGFTFIFFNQAPYCPAIGGLIIGSVVGLLLVVLGLAAVSENNEKKAKK